MKNKKLKALETMKAKIAARIAKLENKISVQRAKQLSALPNKYGFSGMNTFIKALKKTKGGSMPTMAEMKKTRKRALITDVTRTKVKELVLAGQTGAAIAKNLHISLPSVQNIKKAFGLVKAQKK